VRGKIVSIVKKVIGQELLFVILIQVSPTNRAKANESGQDTMAVKGFAHSRDRNINSQLEQLTLKSGIASAQIL
jgi:hypothetical protein